MLRVGILSAAHVHTPSYADCLRRLDLAELVGVWDDDVGRGQAFAERHGCDFVGDRADLLSRCDAVVVTAENVRHRSLAVEACGMGKHVLCEKPLATTVADAQAMVDAARTAGVNLMTAFPCPFSPAFDKLQARVRNGDIGQVVAVCSTNRGSCPGGWFVQKELSGGGAMIDHTVHVADLLRRLLGCEPVRVQAQIGHNTYDQDWEDTAMLTLEYPNGVFATLDSSWSRPKSFKTWGDVTMNVVGEKGTIELDMFGPAIDRYHPGSKTHSVLGYGSNLDLAMVSEFVASVLENRLPKVTGEDGLAAVRVAEMAYASVGRMEPASAP